MTEKLANIFRSEIIRSIGQLILVAVVGYFSVQKSFTDSVASLDKRLTVIEGTVQERTNAIIGQSIQTKENRSIIDKTTERMIKMETRAEYTDAALRELTTEISKLRVAVAELNVLIKKK